jgi:hypothetical protein
VVVVVVDASAFVVVIDSGFDIVVEFCVYLVDYTLVDYTINA